MPLAIMSKVDNAEMVDLREIRVKGMPRVSDGIADQVTTYSWYHGTIRIFNLLLATW